MSATTPLGLLAVYGYVVLFPLAVFEGPLVTVAAGVLSAAGILDPFIAYGVVVAGDIAGDGLWYLAGSHSEGFLTRFLQRFLGLTARKIGQTKKNIRIQAWKMLTLSKLAQGVGPAGLLAAAASGLSYRRFFLICAAVSFAQCAVFLGIGFFFAEAYQWLSSYANYLVTGTIVGAIALGFLFWYIQWRKK